jgi:NAD(P)-dependent dehydrogenase (short-subunit alcohol dehydrogenase family)
MLFAREGAKIVVNDVGGTRDGVGASGAAAQTVADEIRKAGGEAVPNFDSVTEMAGAQRMVDDAVKHFGGLDIVVNNAGILRDKTFLKMDEAVFDAVIAVHLRGTFNVSQCAARRMIEQKRGGKIVNTTSVSGMFGNFGQANYAAAKAGIYGLTRTLAIELKKHGIQVNAIAPIARTRMTDDLPMFQAMPEETYGPKFIAPGALFLASSLANDLSGEVLAVAGTKMSVYRVVESPGVLRDDPRSAWTAEDIARNWDRIARLS